jgi:hypothetical protein
MTIFGRQPVFWIGVIASAVIAVVQVLSGNGVISDVVAGKAMDATNALAQVITILAPVIAAMISRTQVTPVASPALPQGTKVTVITPPQNPNTTVTV